MAKRNGLAVATEEVIKELRDAVLESDKEGRLGNKVSAVLSMVGLDIGKATEGMEEKEKAIFKTCVALLVMGADDPAKVTAITLLLHDYLIPTYEKKKALEQMVQSLSNAGITAPSK